MSVIHHTSDREVLPTQSIPMPQVLRKHGLRLLVVSDETLRPGLVVELRLRARLQEWRKKPGNHSLWKGLDDEVFVESTWFCEEYSLEFQTASGVDLKVEVDAKIDVGAGAEFEWSSKTKLKVTGNDKVPFGIRGWRI